MGPKFPPVSQECELPDVAILGTSNGIIADGYQRALRDRRNSMRVKVLALGASPCTFLHYRLNRVQPGQFKFGVIETLVNDAASIRRGAFSVAMMEDSMRSAIDRLRQLGSTPLALILPGRNLDQSALAAAEAQSRIFNETRVTHCNFISLLQIISTHLNVGFHEFFRDPAHILGGVAHSVSSEFFHTSLKSPSEATPTHAVSRYKYVSVSACHFGQPGGPTRPCRPLKRIANSLLDDVAFILPEGFALHVPCEAGSYLVALVVNIKNTNCILRITGTKVIDKDFRFEINPQDNKVIVSPCIVGVECAETGVVLSADGEISENMQPTYFTDIHSKPKNRMELLGVVLKTKANDTLQWGNPITGPTSFEWQPDTQQMTRMIEFVSKFVKTQAAH